MKAAGWFILAGALALLSLPFAIPAFYQSFLSGECQGITGPTAQCGQDLWLVTIALWLGIGGAWNRGMAARPERPAKPSRLPSVVWTQNGEQFTITNEGPTDVVITSARGRAAGHGSWGYPARVTISTGIVFDEQWSNWRESILRNDDYRGVKLRVGRPSVVTIPFGSSLEVTYRSAGLVGWFGETATISLWPHQQLTAEDVEERKRRREREA